MPNTPLGIPYPLLTDAPNGPSQMAALATAIDTLLARRRTISYNDYGLATSGTVNVYTTANRTITDPFGAGVGFHVHCTYMVGLTGGSCRAVIYQYLAGAWVPVRYSLANPTGGGNPVLGVDMPSGGTVLLSGGISNLAGTCTTYADNANHVMLTEVTNL